MHKFEDSVLETVGIVQGAVSSTAGEVAGAAVDMAKFNNFVGIVMNKAQTQYGGIITVGVAEGTTSTQFAATNLATVTIASDTATDQIDTIEVRAEEMTEGYRYLRLEVTPTTPGTAMVFEAINLRFNPRFAAVR